MELFSVGTIAPLLHVIPVAPALFRIKLWILCIKSNADVLENKLGSAYIEGPRSPKAGLGTLAEGSSLGPLV